MIVTYEFERAGDPQKKVRFEHDIEPATDDVIDYFAADDSKAAFKTAKIMMQYLDWDELENDEWFIEFMRDRYESDARDAFMREEADI